MTVISNRSLGGIRYPSGPVEGAPVMVARGQETLGAGGNINVAIPGFPATSTALASYDNSTGGPTGFVVAGYNSGTGVLQIASTAGAGDAGEIVNWILMFF